MAVHTILPPPLTDAVDAVLRSAGEPHVAHGDGDPVGAAVAVIAGDHEYGLQLDGIQGESFPGQDVEIALVYAPGPLGVVESRRAAELVLASRDLEEMRRLGGFDEHGDPLDPLVRFERYDAA
jgi:hypothetical protein